MPKFSVSLGYFFTDLPVPQRFQPARDAGFRAVELFWPKGWSAVTLSSAKEAADVEVVQFNMNEGDYENGDRGFACEPDRREWWREQLLLALDLARHLDCHRINVLPGKVPPDGDRQRSLDCFVENLQWAAPLAAVEMVQLLIEPLNHLSHPRQLCQRTIDVLQVLDLVQQKNVLLQYDVFHAQRSEGNIIDTLRAHIGQIGHVQIADVPTRSSPGTGELNFENILRELDVLGYPGYVGLEYQPPNSSALPFDWLAVSQRG